VNPFRRFPIQTKLTIGFVSVIVLLAMVAVLGQLVLARNQAAQQALYEGDLRSIADLGHFRSNQYAEQLAVSLLIDTSTQDSTARRESLAAMHKEDETILTRLQASLTSDPRKLGNLGELNRAYQEMRRTRENELFPLLAQGRVAEARALFTGVQTGRHARIDALIDELVGAEESQGAVLLEESSRRARRYIWAFLAVATGAVGTSLLLAALLRRLVAEFLAEQARAEAELRRTNRTLRVLSNGNQALVRAASERELLDEICQVIAGEDGYRMAWVGYAETDEKHTVRPVAQAGFEAGYLEKAHITWADNERGRGPTGAAIRSGQPLVCHDIQNDPTLAPWRAEAIRLGYASSIALPLRHEGRTFGALTVYAAQPDAFDADELALLSELSSDLAYGIMALRGRAERAQAEKSLQRSEESLREAQRLAHLGNWDLDLVTNVLTWSDEIYRIFEVDRATFGASYEAFLAAVHPEDREQVNRAYTESVKNRTPYTILHRLLMRDGRVKHVAERGETRYDDAGKPVRSIGTVQDITDRTISENELRQRNRALQLVNRTIAATRAEEEPTLLISRACAELAQSLDIPQACVILLDEQGKAHTYSGGAAASTPPMVSPLVECARPLQQLFADEKEIVAVADTELDPRLAPLREQLRKGGLRSLLYCPLDGEATIRGAMILGDRQPRAFPPEEITLAGTIATEISGALARVRLHETGRRLATAIEQSPESVVVTDLGGRILYVNPAFTKLTGYDQAEAIGQNPRLLKSGQQDAEFYRAMWQELVSGRVWHGRLVNKRKDGTLFTEDAIISPVHDSAGAIVNYVAIKRDVTHELQLEAQYLQAQKMEAFGQLAGGVAHDFNNILAVIMMHLNLMQLDPALSAKHQGELKELENDAQRAANLTRQLLMFTRRHVMQIQPLDLNQVLNGLFKMLRRILGENIKFDFQAGTSTVPIEADAGMIEQVVMNLCVNARDAMPQGGTLTITTRLTDLDGHYVQGSPRSGQFAVLSVTDTGSGMDDATKKRLFEPFFTTKAAGKGTGLGLATVHGIVEQHHGWLEVESALKKGSTFRVFLPALSLPSAQTAGPAEAVAVPGGTESILVVEDETPVRQLIAKCLLHHGYQVVTAANGVEAMQKWEQQDHQFDLLFTDMIMPEGITGIDLAEQLCRAKDSLKVVVCSGYSAKVKESQSPLAKSALYLPKPFDINALLLIVRQALDRK
jgi:PAS domain S-box-containing protein